MGQAWFFLCFSSGVVLSSVFLVSPEGFIK
jgi:hypothetical protein